MGGGTCRLGGSGGSDASTRVSLAGMEGSGSTGPSWRDAFRFLHLSCAARHPKQLANTLPARPADGSLRNEEIGRFWAHPEQYLASIAAVVVKNRRAMGRKLAKAGTTHRRQIM
jgi:hypothetical protein